jgi:hypothetical protein
MKTDLDPFVPIVVDAGADDFAELSSRPAGLVDSRSDSPGATTGAVTACFHGFDLDDRPLLTGLPGIRYEIVAASSTTPLRRSQVGATVVVLCENGDVRKPIVMGVLQERPVSQDTEAAREDITPKLVSVQADDDALVLSAERQIVLKCGAASITLTRAGKVLINGAYVLSRSSGYNKIKGAAVDIN